MVAHVSLKSPLGLAYNITVEIYVTLRKYRFLFAVFTLHKLIFITQYLSVYKKIYLIEKPRTAASLNYVTVKLTSVAV
jgi:hypothetical protein